MTTIERRLLALQQKLEHLNAEVTTLIALTSATQPATAEFTTPNVSPLVGTTATPGKKSPVGINRYHQLQVSK